MRCILFVVCLAFSACGSSGSGADGPEPCTEPNPCDCCTSDQTCISDICIDNSAQCEYTEDCPPDHLCDPLLGLCVPRDAVNECEYMPPPGVLAPVQSCRWEPKAGDAYESYSDVVMTPSVMNMTDDNGDGKTDTLDGPDIVFISFDRSADNCCTPKGVVRVINGACNADQTMSTIATIDFLDMGLPAVGNSSGVALGNLHPNTDQNQLAPEIVVTSQTDDSGGRTIAFRRTADDGSAWEIMWTAEGYPGPTHSEAGAQPSIADVNHDGQPDVIIGNVVLNGLDGLKMWDGKETVGASAGVGNNAFLGPNATLADLDLDGQIEVIAGNTVYNGATGAEVFTYDLLANPSSGCQGGLTCDGFNGVGNFDGDPEGEVVIIARGEAYIVNHDGTLLQHVTIPKGATANNESGPPTVADFDGDGRPEIGTAGADFYVVIDLDCTGTTLPPECDSEFILWKVTNDDDSSRATGSSVFDFEGDGKAEVLYADETSFRIFSGVDGAVIYSDTTHRSNTRMEMPIVVDVDNDGKSEVVVPEPNTNTGRGGIDIWEDDDNNWVRTRRVWNQHSYHVTNISETGQVPVTEPPNWSNPRLNNFRQNVQPDGLFDAPDIILAGLLVDSCSNGVVTVSATIGNQGALAVAPGVPVYFVLKDNIGQVIDSKTITTTAMILVGNTEVLQTELSLMGNDFSTVTIEVYVDDDGNGGAAYNECIEDNNDGSATIDQCPDIE